MFKHYKDLCDVVSLLVFCPTDRCYLFVKESSGELWLPSGKCEKNCWRLTANKMIAELFGIENTSSQPLRVYKNWLPNHPASSVFHVIYKVIVKSDVKKRLKGKFQASSGSVMGRSRIQWYTNTELERQRAHCALRSPEVILFATMAAGEVSKEYNEVETGNLIENFEDNVLVDAEVAGGAAMASPNNLLLQAACYTRDDQIRLYREFVLMVYPATFMSPSVFTQFMLDIGWLKSQCFSLFRSADINGRGGLSFQDLLLFNAALEPVTHHGGIPAEIRCKYIFRYYDSNHDQKLEFVEFKELVAAARAARQLPVDALSVAKDAEVCLRQLGLQPTAQLPFTEFMRSVGEQRLRGTSSLLRAPRSVAGYLIDLQERDRDSTPGQSSQASKMIVHQNSSRADASRVMEARPQCAPPAPIDYALAVYTVRIRKKDLDLIEITEFDDAVSPSTARLVSLATQSTQELGPSALPVEALAAVHYFASSLDKSSKFASGTIKPKVAYSWSSAAEETAMGNLLLRLSEAVKPICLNEPRLLRLTSPVYAIGDLHGNLAALLAMESALWPSGPALLAARLLFLGDYVDRGAYGVELMAYLLAAKLQRPSGVLMIRGNHETRDIQKMFTFYNECIVKYGDTEGVKIWHAINNVFDALPLAAIVDDKIFCCHGGIPPPWVCPLVSAIDKIPVPLPQPGLQSSLAWELMWNDPVKPNKITTTIQQELAANEGFAANAKRGTGHMFDQSALDRFLVANQLSHVVRAHEVQENGFMLRGRLVTVFSSYRYCGASNDSGVVLVEGGKLRMIRLNAD